MYKIVNKTRNKIIYYNYILCGLAIIATSGCPIYYQKCNVQ